MKLLLAILAAVFLGSNRLCADALPAASTIATNAARVAERMMKDGPETGFDFTATVLAQEKPTRKILTVGDSSGGVGVLISAPLSPTHAKVGDLVRITGRFSRYDSLLTFAEADKLTVLSHGPPPPVVDAPLTQVADGKFDRQLSRITATISDAFRDEIDPLFVFLVLSDGQRHLYAPFATQEDDWSLPRDYIGARVSVTGICTPCCEVNRRLMGRLFHIRGLDDITVLSTPSRNPFAVEELPNILTLSPALIASLGRRRMSGHVLAVCQGDTVLIRRTNGLIARLDLADSPPPAFGEFIETVGIPETDLYRINLSRAIWRNCDGPVFTPEPATAVTARELTTDESGKSRMQPSFHGHAIRLVGIVRSLPSGGFEDGRMLLDNEGIHVTVDASSCPASLSGVQVGSRIAVAGTCVMEIDNWRPNAVFPRIRGFKLVVRTPADVRVLANPPWWTTDRLWWCLAILLGSLAAVFGWTISLARVAERRGKALYQAHADQEIAKTRADERTRLAIELHDAISQNLTGVALEIKAGNYTLAGQTLKSCREELRHCLWDLRNNALGAADMNEAILETLRPQIGNTRVHVRFNVPRSLFSENMAHGILKIIRELAVNAITHGHATNIRVAGSMENDMLLFSVADDGVGFDPDLAPGPEQGHFGLLGVRERLEKQEGTLVIESRPGKGTKVTASIRLDSIAQEKGTHVNN